MPASPRACIESVLRRQPPARFVYAPNYWQWFAHHLNHRLLPPELAGCRDQLDLIRHLGLDVFSRNAYCDQQSCWFGGLAQETLAPGTTRQEEAASDDRDRVITRTYHTPRGPLTERQRYVFAESTLVQEAFLLDGSEAGLDAFDALVHARRWRFDATAYAEWQARVGDAGFIHPGELYSPLKLLHLAAGADNAVFLLQDHPERCRAWMDAHEEAQLDLVRQMLAAGVPSMIAMDNLDAAFHPPHYLEQYSARFYQRASELCHAAGATFFIHACGHQRAILPLVASLGVDGLEGVAFPPLGNVELDEALQLAGDRLIITGGISAMETERLQTRDDVRRYVEGLLRRLQPYRHRFMLSASCNTSIRTRWETLVWFRDAWVEFGA
ncbi:uroporphyrinogen decarboxylase family protein [Opitutus sp. ER46]|uniref:uroporphyrinogen decarboxylase family protein n=1 Tax=Opitutus sp. ER46 TaxID=2161864 RepID=UPI000D31E665|nr:uroporphyrinogen decarboxylase family protein [Opitutus sp. ER46]PTX97957.1 hypothetical protein DB354_06720 [Opitutus sp. ER46]